MQFENLTATTDLTSVGISTSSATGVKISMQMPTTPTASDDSTAGYSEGSLWETNGVVYTCINASPNAAVWVQTSTAKITLDQTRPPGCNDDENAGYSICSRWITTKLRIFACVDSTPGAAKWTELTDLPRRSGFYDYQRADSEITVDEATRTFTIAPTSDNYRVIIDGRAFVIDSALSVQFPDVEGLHRFYLQDDPVELVTSMSSDPFEQVDAAYVSNLVWNSTDKRVETGPFDERHGIIMDRATHRCLHNTLGTQWRSGLSISVVNVDGDGSSESDLQISMTAGSIADEDLNFEISNNAPLTLSPTANLPVFYLSADGYPRRSECTTSIVKAVNGRAVYNTWNGSEWVLEEIPTRRYGLCHIYATTSLSAPIFVLVGQEYYTSLQNASEAALTAATQVSFGATPPEEVTPIGTLIFYVYSSYSNSASAKFVSTVDGDPYVDLRRSKLSALSSMMTAHNMLPGIQGGRLDEYFHLTEAEYRNQQTINSSTAILSEAVSAGEPIRLYEEDSVRKATKINFFESHSSKLSDTRDIKVVAVNNSEAILIYRNNSSYLEAAVIEKTEFGITKHTPIVLKSDYVADYAGAFRASDNKLVVVYNYHTSEGYKTCLIGVTKTGTSLATAETEYEINSATFSDSGFTLMYESDADCFILSFVDAATSHYAALQAFSLGDSTFSSGTRVVVNSESTQRSLTARTFTSMDNGTEICILFGNGSTYSKFGIYSISGLNLTQRTETTIASDGTFSSGDERYQIILSGDEMMPEFKVITQYKKIYSDELHVIGIGYDTMMGELQPYTISTYHAYPNENAALALLTFPGYGIANFIYYQQSLHTATSSGYQVYCDATSRAVFNVTRQQPIEDNAFQFQLIPSPFDDTTAMLILESYTSSELRIVDPANILNQPAIVCLANEGGSTGDTITVASSGSVCRALSDLETGATYYLDLNGEITTRVTETLIGIALSSTELVLK